MESLREVVRTEADGRSRTVLRFMSAREEQAGHSWLASLMLLQSRQRTAWLRGTMVLFILAFMAFNSY